MMPSSSSSRKGGSPGTSLCSPPGAATPSRRSAPSSYGHDAYWDEFFAAEDVFYGHVLNIKGLERRVVVLAINGFYDRAVHRLYVGLSRARSLLVVVGDPGDIWDAGGDEVLEAIGAR
ncbi:hypothetical protein [Brachybacterium hainanense]|uniref:UvrD-like helicase C-terminal domain-containing protein n=1 Tax=Brachybacterium hainanense TaxID=1541174 RepID=A0ABV6R853_9MICO